MRVRFPSPALRVRLAAQGLSGSGRGRNPTPPNCIASDGRSMALTGGAPPAVAGHEVLGQPDPGESPGATLERPPRGPLAVVPRRLRAMAWETKLVTQIVAGRLDDLDALRNALTEKL